MMTCENCGARLYGSSCAHGGWCCEECCFDRHELPFDVLDDQEDELWLLR